MIETLYSLGALGSPAALAAAFIIGVLFGLSLEKAGFGSSRRLAGVFYLRDMAVLKVMFTALVTAMLGLCYLEAAGLVKAGGIFLMPTIYGAQIAGGLAFGVGFAMGGWCPGTAATGLASGKLDALLFLAGAIGGSILFNEMFPALGRIYTLGDRGVRFIYDTLGIRKPVFVFLSAAAAVACFWISECIEEKTAGGGKYLRKPFLGIFSAALLLAAWGVSLLPPEAGGDAARERRLMSAVGEGADHISPEALADRLMGGDRTIFLVDVRPPEEFAAFHIKGAVNIEIPRLADALSSRRRSGIIVLYSNGMTHPAEARDSLERLGYANVYVLTDGMTGFVERCLMPVSLRDGELTPAQASRVNAWRRYFAPR